MFKNLLGALWRITPKPVRRRVTRTGQRRFTVTVGALIFDDQQRILLLEHVFRPDSSWGIPGGFVNDREQPEEAVRRELREEVGLELADVEFLFARTLGKPRQLEIYFRARARNAAQPSSFEIKSSDWFALDNLPGELSLDQRRLIQRALSVGEKSAR
jgi:ADP-ribose pyrophosphatase YjhB (NUDIX family)